MADNEARITKLSSFMRSPLLQEPAQTVNEFLGRVLKEGERLSSSVFPYVSDAKRWLGDLRTIPPDKLSALLSSPYYEGLASYLHSSKLIEPGRLGQGKGVSTLLTGVTKLFNEQLHYPAYLDLVVVSQNAIYKYIPKLERFLQIRTLHGDYLLKSGKTLLLPVLSVLRSLYIAHEAGYHQGLILLGLLWAYVATTSMKVGVNLEIKWGIGEYLLGIESNPFWVSPMGFELSEATDPGEELLNPAPQGV